MKPTPLHLKPDTLAVMRERDQAASEGDMPKYRSLRNKAVRLLRRDKLDSNQTLLDRSRFDPRKVWALTNSAIGRGAGEALPQELDGISGGNTVLAEHVNSYYINKISKLRSGIVGQSSEAPGGVQQQQELPGAEEELVLRPPTVAEVVKVIMSLKNTGAEGVDGIPVSVLKMGVGVLAEPIRHLIMVSLTTAKVPDGFKKANVIPIHKKKKPPNNASSYRPVAILPALSNRRLPRHLVPGQGHRASRGHCRV